VPLNINSCSVRKVVSASVEVVERRYVMAEALEKKAKEMTGNHDSQDFKELARQFLREKRYL
jgi:hypothetical protein